MGNPYTSVSVSGYNSNPPADDGSEVEANRVKWSTIKTKLPDPLKTAIESINSGLLTAFAKVIGGAGVTTASISYSVVSGDQGKLIKATNSGITITSPDATSEGSPFVFGVLNNSSGDITFEGNGSQTVDGLANFTVPAGRGFFCFTDGSNWFTSGQNWSTTLPPGFINGCTLSNGTDATNDINIAAGVCRDSTDAVDIVVPAISGKQLDANWAPGGTAGMRNSAVGIVDGTYHIYAVRTAASSAGDVYAYAGAGGTDPDSSASISTMLTALQAESGGANYVYARRIGSILRVSSAILAFVQLPGGEFRLKVPVLSVNGVAQSTTDALRALTVPLGVKVMADANVEFVRAVNSTDLLAALYISSPDVDDMAANFTASPLGSLTTRAQISGGTQELSNVTIAGRFREFTNTSAQWRFEASTSVTLYVATLGWKDYRGQDA